MGLIAMSNGQGVKCSGIALEGSRRRRLGGGSMCPRAPWRTAQITILFPQGTRCAARGIRRRAQAALGTGHRACATLHTAWGNGPPGMPTLHCRMHAASGIRRNDQASARRPGARCMRQSATPRPIGRHAGHSVQDAANLSKCNRNVTHSCSKCNRLHDIWA